MCGNASSGSLMNITTEVHKRHADAMLFPG
jgi:hypothetical protein